mmetsp:Transcript_11237/g.22593  ORF Transcript_11237/g.22593 Transcript_11237/m.22593 type:complete len:220 (-) Transcript_11237:1931-2590(-)
MVSCSAFTFVSFVPIRVTARQTCRRPWFLALSTVTGRLRTDTTEFRTRADSSSEMERIGAALADVARVGDVILLHGELGSGKTSLARGYIRHFTGTPQLVVTSPTYLLDNAYPDEGTSVLVGVPVHHMDLWRLRDCVNTTQLDLERVFEEDVSLIEWPDRLNRNLWPNCRMDVQISVPRAQTTTDGEGPRDIVLQAHGNGWVERIEDVIRLFQMGTFSQ